MGSSVGKCINAYSNLPVEIEYRMLNAVGMPVLSGRLGRGSGAIPTGPLPPGMYMLEIMSNQGMRQVLRVMRAQ